MTDTHCHLNMIIKKEFDVPMPSYFRESCLPIIEEAKNAGVTRLINVGTSVVESNNCILLAKTFQNCWAAIGTHPNDLKKEWRNDIATYKKWLLDKEQNKIVAIGEIGLDYHYPDYNKQLQYDGLKAQIEVALEHNLAIIIHTRDAGAEVLQVLEEYKHQGIRGIMHCFSEDLACANYAIELGFVLGIGGTLTYPKNESLRHIFKTIPLHKIVLETDAPFLPPQPIRGQRNSPAQITTVAQYLATLRGITIEEVKETTEKTVTQLVNL